MYNAVSVGVDVLAMSLVNTGVEANVTHEVGRVTCICTGGDHRYGVRGMRYEV